MADSAHELRLLRRRLLGWGLACREIMPGADLGRDLELASGDGGRDLARVEGMDNLTQDLSIALTTLLGSDVFNTRLGFDGLNALVDETDPVLARERVRIGVIQVLRNDARVRRIVDVKLAGGQLELPSAGSRQLDITVTFETVAAEQATLALGKVIPNV
jgi:hypothetical protein